MFKNILICSFIPENNTHVLDVTFELAKKFDSNVTLLKCLHDAHSTFGWFKTKSDKQKQNELHEKVQLVLQDIEKMAKDVGVSIKTESVFVESLSDPVPDYVKTNDIDLLVVDSTPPSDIDAGHHKDIVNHIYKSIECPILTLK